MNTVTITVDPQDLLVWAVIGLIAGFLASRVMLGHGLGIVADLLAGLAGAFAGGFLASYFGVSFNVPGYPLVSEVVIAFLGALVVLGLLRLVGAVRPSRARR
jgi:uncharacterized membrane protein YeaQ/YmgE (transglycosylase-associated protein family)